MQNGDESALTNLYFKYKDKIFGFCLKFTGSEVASQQMLHCVFVALWENREEIAQETSLHDYLFGLTRNCIVDFHSSSARQHSKVCAPDIAVLSSAQKVGLPLSGLQQNVQV